MGERKTEGEDGKSWGIPGFRPHSLGTYVLVRISCDSAICFNLVSPSFSLRVPFSKANSRSCCLRRSFWPSGT